MGNSRTAAAAPTERFIALDSLRGLAAVGVVLYHVGPFGLLAGLPLFANGWLLVDFFFVLSGFVIAASYGQRLSQGFSRTRFIALRLGRVLPLHVAMVGVFVTLEFAVFRPVLGEAHSTYYLWRGAFLLDGLAAHAGNFYAPVSWSISVEIMLYIASAALFGAGRWGKAAAGAMMAAAAILLIRGSDSPVFGFLLQRGVLGFGLGVLAHTIHRSLRTRPSAEVLSASELALGTVTLWFLCIPPGGRAGIVAADVLFAAVVVLLARDGGVVSRALQTRPMVRLGQLSYSIYMIHLLLVIGLNRGLPHLFTAMGRSDLLAPHPSTYGLLSVELGLPAETVLTVALLSAVIALSAVTFRWIEEPARGWARDRLRAKSGVPLSPGHLPGESSPGLSAS